MDPGEEEEVCQCSCKNIYVHHYEGGFEMICKLCFHEVVS